MLLKCLLTAKSPVALVESPKDDLVDIVRIGKKIMLLITK
jgi:hypothetical protein